jgi:hypothetical protein
MRRSLLFSALFALLLGSLMAPFQHVHQRLSGPHSHVPQAHDDDDDAAIVHIHFVVLSLPHGTAAPQDLRAPGDDHVARALDTFTAVAHASFPALVLPVSQALLDHPGRSQERFVEELEPCGHDPPLLDASIPRAPPA